MSVDFCVVLSAPALDLAEVFAAVARNLENHGFLRPGYITRIEPAESDLREGQAEVELPFDTLAEIQASSWNGGYASFESTDMNLNVVVLRWKSTFLNVHIETSVNTLRRVHRAGGLKTYLTSLTEIARACRAEGGVGDYNFDTEPIDPRDIVSAIKNNPSNPGYPANLGLVPKAHMGRETVERFAAGAFRIVEPSGYWLLVGFDFEKTLDL